MRIGYEGMALSLGVEEYVQAPEVGRVMMLILQPCSFRAFPWFLFLPWRVFALSALSWSLGWVWQSFIGWYDKYKGIYVPV